MNARRRLLLGHVLGIFARDPDHDCPLCASGGVATRDGWAFNGLYHSVEHYYRNGQSLCRRYRADNPDTGIIGQFRPDLGPEPGQCKECRRRLERGKA